MIISDTKYWKSFNTLQDAILYIDILAIDGYNDWRVPNLTEYQIIQKTFWEVCEGNNPNGAITVLEENINLLLEMKDLSFENHFVIPVRNKGN